MKLRKSALTLFMVFFVAQFPVGLAQATSSSDALSLLKAGNDRFLSGKVRKDGQSQKDIEKLSHGQTPHTIVLSCSDSRVPPEIVFDQKLGDIFTVRSAGETLSPTAIGSIEYAVSRLGAHLILVLGHTSCGAVGAALETPAGKSTGSLNLDQVVADIQHRIQGKFNEKAPSKNMKNESLLNARGVAQELLLRSPLLSKAAESGSLSLKVALYDLASGQVEFEN